ncbi:ABC transporter ATP-binding protein/permease [Kitasatospora sp. NBC_01250]|uniref:ABC transporter ATP-binding protein n=1 Tax=unclassified Kitasatospora TaxID=2633591 RepID=UPI002E112A3E|nr:MULTISPECIES: ABC transporter ATP-binding protein [unclassified Kitasatospora]WSJ70846.1 ABC transporter ATP-binding protein/permease [Kitasatospora sp. NBC_01302]
MSARPGVPARLARLCWQVSRARCCLILLTVLIGAAGQPVVGLLLREVTEDVLAGHRRSALLAAALTAVVWALANQVQDVRNLLLNDVRALAGLRIDEEVLRLTSDIPGIGHLEDAQSLDRIGVIKGVVVVDALAAAVETAGSVLGIGATLAALATVSPLLLATLPLALPTLWFNRLGQARLRRAADRAAEPQRTADQLLATLLDPATATEVRVTGAGELLLDVYQERWEQSSRIRVRARAQAAVLLLVGHLVFVLGTAAALGYLAWRMSRGQAGVGDLVLLLAVTSQQQGLVQATVAGFTRTADGLHAARAERWLRDRAAATGPAPVPAPAPAPARPTAAEPTLAVPARLASGITLDAVSFRYPGTERTVLHEVSAAFPPGSVVALVGAHGSGKTSVVKLLTAMYRPQSGVIRLDGQPLDRHDHQAWRSRIACGFQDFVRFQTPAREAVGTGDLPRIDDLGEVSRAVRQGGAQAVVERLEQGLDTRLGTLFDGVELSGGQWQKLALARTCMRQDPLLVVLDEPTAALDPRSEYEVFRQQIRLARELAGRSGTVTLIISHRFSTVRAADTILVLAEGAVVEQGSHEQLITAGGEYARMYGLQQAAYRARPEGGPDDAEPGAG